MNDDGHEYSFWRCPVWLPQDPNVEHKDRTQCALRVRHEGPHLKYVIDELELS